jgi:hypothetical protein
MPYYIIPTLSGIQEANSAGDGTEIYLRWGTAYPAVRTHNIAYQIYYSEIKETVFTDGVKFVVKGGSTTATFPGFTPGEMYYFAVRAVEYDPSIIDLTILPGTGETGQPTNNIYYLPTTLLMADISDTANIIPIMDAIFPAKGIVAIGGEAIYYDGLASYTQVGGVSLTGCIRGFLGTTASLHQVNGYDGIIQRSPIVRFFLGIEEQNGKIYECQSRFEIGENAYIEGVGHHQTTGDDLNVDLSASDAANVGFQSYDYAGYHATDPTQLLNGDCLGSYSGGEQYIDSPDGTGTILRGLSVQEQNNQRQEMLLSVTGEPIVLLSRRHTGITCNCYIPSSEYPDDRCPRCYGTGFVGGFEQYHNPRRSDGRIMARFNVVEEDIKMQDAGLESESMFDVWTLTVPTVRDRDVIIRFGQDNNEEFRYEVINVTRNRMLNSQMGAQKFKAQRIRKTDTAYQVRSFRDSSRMPSKVNTSLAMAPGIVPHSHVIVINENTKFLANINQETSTQAGHQHTVINGIVQPALGHVHTIIIP